jgi:hypothetical protein
MSDPIPLYSEHSNPCIQYLEFEAINLLHFDGKIIKTINLYRETLSLEGTGFEGLDFLKVWAYKKTVDAEALYAKIDNELTDLVSFYQALDLYLSTPDVSGAPEIVWPERKVKPVKIDKPKRPKPSAKPTIIDPDLDNGMLSDQSKPIAGDAPVPVFNNHSDLPTRYIEWLAIFQLVFKGDREAMRLAYNDGYADVGLGLADSFHKATKKVSQHPRDKSKRDLLSLKGSVFTKGQTFDAFMVEMRKRRRRITVKDKKVAGQTMAREAYQRQELGPAYVDDKPLYSAVKALATPDLAERHLSDAHIDELILTLDGVAELSDEQRVSLRENTLRPRLDKFNAQGLVEAAIVAHAEQMATGGKALAFLWLKLKHTYLKDDMIVMSQDQIAKFAGISKAHAGPAMKVLLKLGAIEQISKARRNSFDATAAKYRRLV